MSQIRTIFVKILLTINNLRFSFVIVLSVILFTAVIGNILLANKLGNITDISKNEALLIKFTNFDSKERSILSAVLIFLN